MSFSFIFAVDFVPFAVAVVVVVVVVVLLWSAMLVEDAGSLVEVEVVPRSWTPLSSEPRLPLSGKVSHIVILSDAVLGTSDPIF